MKTFFPLRMPTKTQYCEHGVDLIMHQNFKTLKLQNRDKSSVN